MGLDCGCRVVAAGDVGAELGETLEQGAVRLECLSAGEQVRDFGPFGVGELAAFILRLRSDGVGAGEELTDLRSEERRVGKECRL